MRLRRPPLPDRPETIIPLVDVVFFLLVFFMLIGRLDATAPFAVEPPVAQTGSDLPGGGITIAIDRAGALALDGAKMDEPALLASLDDRRIADADLRVRLNADGAAEVRHLLPLVARLSELGYADVVLVVTPGLP
jgi:biopolymer transport protein ExbD